MFEPITEADFYDNLLGMYLTDQRSQTRQELFLQTIYLKND